MKHKIKNVDFIKIDIDGADLEAIISCENTLKDNNVLGFMLEVNFYGSTLSTDHTFINTDKIMREKGFDLFDLDFRRYSSDKLPGAYEVGCLAQTIFGRIFQGDALYLIDPCAKDDKPILSIDKILKLACLYECFGKPDHSAELLLKYKEELTDIVDINNLLNILTNEINPKFDNYYKYIEAFENNPLSFFPKEYKKLQE